MQHYHVRAMGEVARKLSITVSAGEQSYTLDAVFAADSKVSDPKDRATAPLFSDAAAAAAFYCGLFGWTAQEIESFLARGPSTIAPAKISEAPAMPVSREEIYPPVQLSANTIFRPLDFSNSATRRTFDTGINLIPKPLTLPEAHASRSPVFLSASSASSALMLFSALPWMMRPR